MGAYSNVNQATKGEVAELIVFDSVLSTSERQKIEGYLAHKWGLSSLLPQAHPASGSLISSPNDIDTHSVNLSNLVSGNTYITGSKPAIQKVQIGQTVLSVLKQKVP